ncbi:MAG: DUF1501 domain-containing protein [Acidimicrobiales bacterium]
MTTSFFDALVSRRRFVGWTAVAASAGAVSAKLAFATPEDAAQGDLLVAVFLRGGADGLSFVPPYGDDAYYQLRPTIAIPRPGQAGGALDLNGFFGLHPAMRSLYEGPWTAGRLAIVNAAGWPSAVTDTRSHFEAQDFWERGSVEAAVRSGWIARHLSSSASAGAAPGVGFGSSLQTSLRGFSGSLSVSRLDQFGVRGFGGGDTARVRTALSQLYGAAPGQLGAAGTGLLAAAEQVTAAAQIPPSNGVTYPDSDLAQGLRQVAQLARGRVGLRAAALDVGGWDMHDDMGTSTNGQMAGRAGAVADALTAFSNDLGAQLSEVTVVVMSEFGRTSRENGNGGTDHGRGSVMFVMGGAVTGGLYGQWPTLTQDNDPDRDLSVTTDQRAVLSEIVTGRLGNSNLGAVFPSFTPAAPLGLAAAMAQAN